MADYDPAKEAINLAKHGVSLARWIDLEVLAIVRDDRFDYGEPRYRAMEPSMVFRIVSSSPFATTDIAQSASGAPTQRK
jgi:uncharacterized DUF497 family protein